MDVLFIAGGALVVPLFIAMAAIGLVGVSIAIEVAALATQTVTLRSFPAAWSARRDRRRAVKAASAARVHKRISFRFLTAPAILYLWRWLALATAALVVTVVAIPATNLLIFEHCLRLALRGLERSHGMVVTYQSAQGDWLAGRADLRGARLQRRGHQISDFDLKLDRLLVDCDARKVISGEFAIESVMMKSVRGHLTQTGRRDPSQPRRHYTIDRLTIDDAKLDFVDRSRPPEVMRVPLEVSSLEVDDYRSRWSLFDVLFRSDTRGTIYGQPFEITRRTTDEVHESDFKVTDLPLSLLGQRISTPLGGRVDGLVNAEIRTQWQPDDESAELNMHCHLLAHSFTMYMPNNPIARVAAPAVASRVPRNMPLEFDVAINKQVFDGQTSFVATGVLDSIGQGASQQRRQMSPPNSSVRPDKAFRQFSSGIRSLIKPGGR